MSVEEALDPDNLLGYEMNGAPLPPAHGFPVRLIAPGWYGVANVSGSRASRSSTSATPDASWRATT